MLNRQQSAEFARLLNLKSTREQELAFAEGAGNHKAVRFLKEEVQKIQVKRNAFLLSLGHNEMASAA